MGRYVKAAREITLSFEVWIFFLLDTRSRIIYLLFICHMTFKKPVRTSRLKVCVRVELCCSVELEGGSAA